MSKPSSIGRKSQHKFSDIRKEHYLKLRRVKAMIEGGQKVIYAYGSAAIKEAIEKRRGKCACNEFFHPEYEPDFTDYQYDLEMFIFLNYNELYCRELEIGGEDRIKLMEEGGIEYGATFLRREDHLANAMSIRWPEKELPDGSISTAYALTPWAKDYLYGLANYNNIVVFGGGGQGKTYSSLAFMVLLYDHFIMTKSGAQCSFSSVSEKKLESSAWSHMNKLQSFLPRYKFSKYAGLAVKSPEYTYRRKNTKGKYVEEGGTIKGILLVKGAKDSKQIDKLTGQHDVSARAYLLDEAQSTGPAPMSAYNNMFIHPKYGWFQMAGNYELDNDLLGLNTEPNEGWPSVDETTHMWESTLKSPDSDLGHKSLVIHYNNNLSPAMLDPEMNRKYHRFLPNHEKKKKLYPTPEHESTYEAKRFWTGFRFERVVAEGERIITRELLSEFQADLKPEVQPTIFMGSLDTAPSNTDRNVLAVFGLSIDKDGYPVTWPIKFREIKKPSSQLFYYKESARNIYDALQEEGIQSGHAIMDWTQRTQLLEALAEMGFTFHHLIYQQACPSGHTINDVTKIMEHPIELDVVPTFQGGFEKEVKTYAHERFINRISLGAYLTRLFIEHGRVRNFNEMLIRGLHDAKTFEKEFCNRFFERKNYRGFGKITTDSKDEFKRKYKFSPDLLDTMFQFYYMIYVLFDIRPDVKGLGSLKAGKYKKVVDNKRWNAMIKFRGPSDQRVSRSRF